MNVIDQMFLFLLHINFILLEVYIHQNSNRKIGKEYKQKIHRREY